MVRCLNPQRLGHLVPAPTGAAGGLGVAPQLGYGDVARQERGPDAGERVVERLSVDRQPRDLLADDLRPERLARRPADRGPEPPRSALPGRHLAVHEAASADACESADQR